MVCQILALLLCMVLASEARRDQMVKQRNHRSRKKEPDILQGFLPICHEEIVKETCGFLNGGNSSEFLPVDVIRTMLSASKDDIISLWKELGFPPFPQGDALKVKAESFKAELQRFGLKILGNAGEYILNVGCEKLCLSLRDYVQHKEYVLPPASDLMCMRRDGKVACNIDVRPEELKKLHPSRTQPHSHDTVEDTLTISADHDPLGKEATHTRTLSTIDYAVWELVEGAAELFRFYPMLDENKTVPNSANSSADMSVEAQGNGSEGNRVQHLDQQTSIADKQSEDGREVEKTQAPPPKRSSSVPCTASIVALLFIAILR